MVLAAGLGLRMRPITERMPKPLVRVAGRSLLDRALDEFAAAGIRRAVVNTHYLASQIAGHLATRTDPVIALSHEPELLETGGGVLNALPLLGSLPFVVVNSDSIWLNGSVRTLARMAAAWRSDSLDALLLLTAIPGTIGYSGRGDFFMDAEGNLSRRVQGEAAPFVFTGIQVLHPRLFAGEPAGAFSLNRLYDKALRGGRLKGLRHDGRWFHVGDAAALAAVEAELTGNEAVKLAV
jgi:MurNAc alpha-1-phosphate uridylyltransferase